jgi:FkbM family methyltransferase
VDALVAAVRVAHRWGWQRGWHRVGAALARVVPAMREYPVPLSELGAVVVDFRESMCFDAVSGSVLSHGEANLLGRLLRPGDVVYDLGANYGLTAALAAARVGPAGRVEAFEPGPAALRLLRMNAASRPNLAVHPVALADRRTTAEFFIARKGNMSSLTAPASGVPVRSSEMVEVWPLDALVRERGLPAPVLVKCDVEGAELKVFQGAMNVLAQAPMVFFEYADSLARPHGYAFGDLSALLAAALPAGTQLFRVAEDGTLFRSLEARPGISNNYLMVPPRHQDRLQGLATG